MKITDPLGRQLVIQVVTKGSRGWMTPLGYQIEGSDTYFARVPHGPYAIQVMAPQSVELAVHLNGQRLLNTEVAAGVQFIEVDGNGRPLVFAEGGDVTSPAVVDADSVADGEAATADGAVDSDEPTAPAPEIPDGEGLLFIVARFGKDTGPLPHPPRMEYGFTFQLNAPADHDTLTATNLRRMVKPPAPPNIDDLSSRECPEHQQLRITCACTGRDSHSH